jgi:hypothetical protein
MDNLHLIISLLIAENGGADKYAQKIESEWIKSQHRPVRPRIYHKKLLWGQDETKYLIDNFLILRNKDIGKYLNRTESSINSRVNLLIKNGTLKPKLRWVGRYVNKVFDDSPC